MKKKHIDNSRLLAAVIIILGIVYFNLYIFSPGLLPKTLRVGTIRHPLNVLILGTDLNFDAATRKPLYGLEGRTDTIMFAHLDPVKYRVYLISIPRDSFVAIPGYGMQKINAAHVFGGIELTKNTVENLMQERIDYYIKVNPEAAAKLINALGGVKLQVEKEMYYNDRAQKLHIDLKEGKQNLSGEKAQEYLRFRHDAEGDIGRIQRQQNFIQALSQTLGKPTNFFKGPIVILSAHNLIETDLPLSTLIRLANFFRMSSTKPTTLSGEAMTVEGAGSVWVVNKDELERVKREFF